MSKSKYQRRPVRVWDSEDDHEDAILVETNGNLSWIEKADGTGDWYSPSEWGENKG